MVDGVSPLGAFLGGQERALGIQQQKLGLEQARAAAPQQAAMRDIQLQRQQLGIGQDETQVALQKSQLLSNAIDAVAKLPADQRFQTVNQLRPELQQFGIDLPELGPEQLTDSELARHKAALTGFAQDPRAAIAQLTAGQREFQGLTQGLSPEEQLQARKVKLGLEPRAAIAASEFGDREAAKLEAQKGRKADIAAEVKQAQEEAKVEVEQRFQTEENQRTFEVFNLALDNLTQSLGGTSLTGPIAGRLPASTTASQIADAAKAVMLPTLKQIFRQAGEGTFTDSDQRALEALLPRREQTKEAQLATIDAIDKIVRAKLGIAQPEQQEAVQPQDDTLLQEAEAAIAAGADREAVMQRLQQLRGGQ